MTSKSVVMVFFSDAVSVDDVLDFLGSTDAHCVNLAMITPADLYQHLCEQLALERDPGVILLVTDNIADDGLIAQMLTVLHNDRKTRPIPCCILCSNDQTEYESSDDEEDENSDRVGKMRRHYLHSLVAVRN